MVQYFSSPKDVIGFELIREISLKAARPKHLPVQAELRFLLPPPNSKLFREGGKKRL